MAKHKFLMHDKADSVGVAVANITKGEKVYGTFLQGNDFVEVVAADNIPWGHKIAVQPVANGDFVIEYNEKIGKASQDINIGDWVHTHNLKSARWVKKTN